MRNFHPLEVVGRGSETQLQIGKNLGYFLIRLCNLALKGLIMSQNSGKKMLYVSTFLTQSL